LAPAPHAMMGRISCVFVRSGCLSMERAEPSGRAGDRVGPDHAMASAGRDSERLRIDPDVEAVLLSPLLRENFAQTALAARQLASQWLRSPAGVPEGGIAALNKVAEVTYLNGDLAGSRKLWERVIALCRRQPQLTARERAAALQGLGTILHKEGDLAGAEERLRNSWKLRCRIAEERTPQAAVALNRLALIRRELGDLDDAEALLRQTLEIRRESLGEAHPDHGISLNNLGALLLARGKVEEAEALLLQAVALRRRILGPDHVDYASSLGNLAVLYQAAGNLERAIELQREALEIRRAQLGPHHPHSAANQHQLADLLLKQGEIGAVLPLLDESLNDPPPAPYPPTFEAFLRIPEASSASRAEHGAAEAESIAHLLSLVRVLEAEYRSLSDELRAAGDLLREPGRPPGESLSGRLMDCRAAFDAARNRALEFARQVGLPIAEGERQDLSGLGRYLARAEGELIARQMRRRAREVLDGALGLSHADDPDFPPLLACRAQASALRERLERAIGPELEDLAFPLIHKSHPLGQLLRLVGGQDNLDDEAWATAFEVVSREYGKSLAAAASRSKLIPT
ncbi:MAG: tetratricopeptide repeat protein, partial [Isosphaeraceae bacterium]